MFHQESKTDLFCIIQSGSTIFIYFSVSMLHVEQQNYSFLQPQIECRNKVKTTWSCIEH